MYTRATAAVRELESTPPSGTSSGDVSALFGDADVAILNFAAVKTQAECEDYLQQFCDEGAFSTPLWLLHCMTQLLLCAWFVCVIAGNPCRHLVVFVDRECVPPPLINSLRKVVDDHANAAKTRHSERSAAALSALSAHAHSAAMSEPAAHTAIAAAINSVPPPVSKRIIVCVLIPPSWMGLRHPYPSLFLDGWDFAFVDTPTAGVGTLSAAAWIRVKFGLSHGFSASDGGALYGANDHLLHAVVLRVPGSRPERHVAAPDARDTSAMEPFYMVSTPVIGAGGRVIPATVADRVTSLQSLADVMGGHTLGSLLAPAFLALFPKPHILQQLDVRLCVFSTRLRAFSFVVSAAGTR